MNAIELDRMKAEIVSWLKREAWGHANAKPRRHLVKRLLFLAYHLPKADPDRAVRKAYEELPQVGSCSRGIFYIVSAEDRRIAQGQLVAPAVAMLERKRQIADAAPSGQMTLPMGGER